MDGKHEHAVAQILEAINYGNLSPEETVKRLKTLVDAEICKTDHPCDLELIDACEDLIYEINTQGRIPFDSRMESRFRTEKSSEDTVENGGCCCCVAHIGVWRSITFKIPMDWGPFIH